MKIIHAIILGLLQGVSEFLPISSSGHLVLLQKIFGIEEGALFFDSMLHLGTLVAVCIHFRKTIWKMICHPFSKYPKFVVLATIPMVALTLLLGDWIEKLFSGQFLGFAFLLTSLFLFIAHRAPGGKRTIKEMRARDALFIGGMQCFALPPGVSRSGATISGGLLCGLDRSFAAEFSFMMSIPAILGSTVLELVKLPKQGIGDVTVPGIVIGFFCAVISGFLAIKLMLNIIKKGKLNYFAIYCAVLGVFVLIDQYLTHFFF